MNYFKPLLIFLCLLLTASAPLIAQAQSTSEEEPLDELEGLEDLDEETLQPLEPPYIDAETDALNRSQKRRRRPQQRTRRQRQEVSSELPEAPLKGKVQKKYIKHPNSKKGLVRITKDDEYIYEVEGSNKSASASLRIGLFDAPNFENGDNGASFNDIYGGNDLMFLFDYEWPLFDRVRGLGFKLGSGLLYAKGNGRLEDGRDSLEEFLFFMFPNSASLTYKFLFSDTQWFYPYIEAGAGAYVFTERRDDNEPPFGRWGAAFNAHLVGGVALSITAFNRDQAILLDADYGVNDVWFTLELRQLVGFGSFDTTSTLINIGLAVDF